MKHTLRQVFRSPKFVAGFIIFSFILSLIIIYPLIVPGNPLEMIGLGTFFKPGIYVSVYDGLNTERHTLKLSDAAQKRIDNVLGDEDRVSMMNWLVAVGIPEEDIDINDTAGLLALWWENYDSSIRPQGMTKALRNYYERLDRKLDSIKNSEDIIIADISDEDGGLVARTTISDTDFINIGDVPNVRILPLGTDNFGRDVLKELVSAAKTSIIIGLIAGSIATFIGLTLGLLAGYIGGIVDDIIMFFTNIFTSIPSFVILILISYSISQDQRGATTVAIVIGCTAWIWTCRSVRSQVISLRNRDHVNLSRLSGHSLFRIIITDILPYIASYVVMALILQISSAILAEAQLSLLGLGPKTTEVPTLGLMMNWAMLYSAHIKGSWWAYFPVIFMIALISFSLNLMNTGLDQVFNPTLRD
ncbi:MAG: ABC transporter permease [Eubacteriales bacterium]|jgi:peptide/nickel transport system permease protein